MPAPTTTLLIEGSFTELCEEFSQYLDNLRKDETNKIQAEVTPLLEPLRQQEQDGEEANLKQRDEVLKKLVLAAAILNAAPEKEIIPDYNLLIYLIHQTSNPDMFLSRICTYLAKPITSSPHHGPALALSILTTIFNTLTPSDLSRYHVFLAILAVIHQSGSPIAFDALRSQLTTDLPTWLTAWELDEEDTLKLHLAISDTAEAAGDHDLSYGHLIEALQTIPANEVSSPESRQLAIRALITALINPSIFDFTPLATADAVQALRSSDTSLFELLEIFGADTLDAYEEFISVTPLSSISGGILADKADILQSKMRLLTLASQAASTPSRSLSYSTIASTLRVPDSEVEKWVIDTIRAGLVEGKLSQLKSEFLVHRATYRVFGEKQWSEIQFRLMVWRRSLESVLSVLRTEREKFVRESLVQQQQQTATGAAGGNAPDGEGPPAGGRGGGGDRGGSRQNAGGDQRRRHHGGGDRGGGHHQQQQHHQLREVELVGGD